MHVSTVLFFTWCDCCSLKVKVGQHGAWGSKTALECVAGTSNQGGIQYLCNGLRGRFVFVGSDVGKVLALCEVMVQGMQCGSNSM